MQDQVIRCRDCGRPLKPFQQQHCADCSHARRLEATRDPSLRRHLKAVHERGAMPTMFR